MHKHIANVSIFFFSTKKNGQKRWKKHSSSLNLSDNKPKKRICNALVWRREDQNR